MSDLSNPSDPARASTGWWPTFKKTIRRTQDWFVIQPMAIKLTVLVLAVLIPATGVYSITLLQKQLVLAEQVKSMAVASGAGEAAALAHAFAQLADFNVPR